MKMFPSDGVDIFSSGFPKEKNAKRLMNSL